MSFAERVSGPTSTTRPSCWGDKTAYSADDDDCTECVSATTCKQEIVNKSRVYGISPTPTRPPVGVTGYRPASTYQRPSQEGPTWTPGLREEGDNPVTRVLKDMLVAGLGGSLREGGRFFDHFRMK